MSTITLAYDTNTLVLSEFTSPQIIRQRIGVAGVEYSQYGNRVGIGNAYTARYQFVVSALLTTTERDTLESLFDAWDTARAGGAAAEVTVTDDTFGTQVVQGCWFIEPPVYSKFDRLSEAEGGRFTVDFTLQ